MQLLKVRAMEASAVSDPDGDGERASAGALEDLLLLALKPFAPAGAVPPRIAAAGAPAELPLWAGTVSVAVALDPAWTGPGPARSLEAASLDLAREHAGARLWTGEGGRAVLLAAGGTLEFPLAGGVAPNDARLSLGPWGTLDFAVPQMAGRLAVVAIRLRAGGDFDLAMASVGVAAEGDHGLTGARLRAAAALAATLAAGGEASRSRSGFLDRIAGGRRTDPVLAPLFWLAAAARGGRVPFEHSPPTLNGFGDERALQPPASGALSSRPDTSIRSEDAVANERAAAARLLVSRFPAVLDGHVLMAAEGGRRLGSMLALATLDPGRARPRAETLYQMAMQARLARPRIDAPDAALRALPLTAAAVSRLADFALEAGRPDHWAVDRRLRLRPDAVWNAVWTPAVGA